MNDIICNDIKFSIARVGSNRVDIKCHYTNGDGQPILTIHELHPVLYMWYDEGSFPVCIDKQLDGKDINRLRITGIDEL